MPLSPDDAREAPPSDHEDADATGAVAAPDRFTVASRRGDRLLVLSEIAALTRRSENQLRWLRHKGLCPPLFKSHGRLFAWESEVVAWLEQEQAHDAATRPA